MNWALISALYSQFAHTNHTQRDCVEYARCAFLSKNQRIHSNSKSLIWFQSIFEGNASKKKKHIEPVSRNIRRWVFLLLLLLFIHRLGWREKQSQNFKTKELDFVLFKFFVVLSFAGRAKTIICVICHRQHHQSSSRNQQHIRNMTWSSVHRSDNSWQETKEIRHSLSGWLVSLRSRYRASAAFIYDVYGCIWTWKILRASCSTW